MKFLKHVLLQLLNSPLFKQAACLLINNIIIIIINFILEFHALISLFSISPSLHYQYVCCLCVYYPPGLFELFKQLRIK